jgi:pimeloyl-ACP methyl ester carboxylesterase
MRNLTFRPLVSVGVVLILYIVFIVIFSPFYGISRILSPWGAFVVFLLCLLLLARLVARAMTFMGATYANQRKIAMEYNKSFIKNILSYTRAAHETFYPILLVLSLDVQNASAGGPLVIPIRDFLHMSSSFIALQRKLLSTVARDSSNGLSSSELRIVGELRDFLEQIDVNATQLRESSAISAALTRLERGPPLGMTPVALRTLFASTNAGNTDTAREESVIQALQKLLLACEKVNAICVDILGIGAAGGAEQSMIRSIKATVDSVLKPLNRFEKLPFPLMKAQLKLQFKAHTFTVRGVDGNVIDCAYIPCNSAPAEGRDTELPVSKHSKGVLMYCGPNAGYFELFGITPREGSYLGLYLGMGFDVCVHNYRGYGMSSGTPTPSRLKADGIAVAKHVLSEVRRGPLGNLSNLRIILHGQSIGGMVASTIAADLPDDSVALLIADRTFASLDAVASRMLGAWAGPALRTLACWNSNNVDAFLAAKCPRIIIQDPNDEIVYHAASLKSGISTFLALDENLWNAKQFDRKYIIAEYRAMPVPLDKVSCMRALLMRSPSFADQMMKGFWRMCSKLVPSQSHFYRSLDADPEGGEEQSRAKSKVSLLIRALDRVGMSFDGLAPRFSRQSPPLLTEDFTQCLAACLMHMKSLAIRADRRLRRGKGSALKESLTVDEPAAEEASGDQHSALVESDSQPNEVISPEISLIALRVWGILSKIGSDGSGQTLGAAASCGYDELRAWICSYLVFSHISVHDPALPAHHLDLTGGVEELKTALADFSIAMSSDSTGLVTSELEEGRVQTSSFMQDSAHDMLDEAIKSGSKSDFSRAMECLIEGLEILIQFNRNFPNLLGLEEHGGDISTPYTSSSTPAPQSTAPANAPIASLPGSVSVRYARSSKHPTCGTVTLLPVHCGHNGYPAPREVDVLSRLIRLKLNLDTAY